MGACDPRTVLAPPSPEARQHLSCKSLDRESGEVVRGGAMGECLRTDAKGKIIDTQYRLISRAHASVRRNRDEDAPRRVRRELSRESSRESRTAHVVVRRMRYAPWGWWGW